MKHNKYLRKINFGIFEKSCNLKCPKCLVYGESFARGREIRKSLGKMNIENIINVFEEIKDLSKHEKVENVLDMFKKKLNEFKSKIEILNSSI